MDSSGRPAPVHAGSVDISGRLAPVHAGRVDSSGSPAPVHAELTAVAGPLLCRLCCRSSVCTQGTDAGCPMLCRPRLRCLVKTLTDLCGQTPWSLTCRLAAILGQRFEETVLHCRSHNLSHRVVLTLGTLFRACCEQLLSITLKNDNSK